MKPNLVIGGGIVGLYTAYYLLQQGEEVEILDQGEMEVNCSTGNAGMIVPSHIVPLASPGMIAKGFSWMLSSKSPFYIQPRLDRRLVDWCMLFYRHSTLQHVKKSIPSLKALSLLSRQLYVDFVAEHGDNGIQLQEKGLLMLYQTKEGEKEEREFSHLARANGLQVEVLGSEDIQRLEPNVEVRARGGIYFPEDAHLSPADLHRYLKGYLIKRGVKIHTNRAVRGFDKQGDMVTAVQTDKGSIPCGQLMICAGAWSGDLAKMLGFRLPMMGGKGYSFELPNQPQLQQASILTEARVSQSPYGPKVRFGGTMEISNQPQKINLNRVQGIFDAISRYYPDFRAEFPADQQIWSGLRPCSPDGLPYIGKSPRWTNVCFGTGHSMMGLSLAPATGKLLAQIAHHQSPSCPLEGFVVDRFC
ncbi:D-amino-acid dehydrogenase [Echinicola pacifica]|uniref:D-amino-acid dehydrogenase n=1 Tax=Echinicola pacifica TaxID=346377 RepID=A0A918Q395_9BACT|nr:FAD-dependent oxidoreductase [Echinicola pacifica]GGZ30377.1 D-amino-acid dehydrogenase [Echinicola pacifica]